MKRTEFPSEPWCDLAGDLLGPLPSGEYLFVVVIITAVILKWQL